MQLRTQHSARGNAFVNANGFFMDDALITIGADVRIGPGAQLMTALHPVDDHRRRRRSKGSGLLRSSSVRTRGSAPQSLSVQEFRSVTTP